MIFYDQHELLPGFEKLHPPIRRLLTSTAGVTLFSALLQIHNRCRCFVLKRGRWHHKTDRMPYFFLPCHIRLFTKRVTRMSLYFASGASGNFLACDFLMSYLKLKFDYFLAAGFAPAFSFFVPYLERLFLRSFTPAVSRDPRTI